MILDFARSAGFLQRSTTQYGKIAHEQGRCLQAFTFTQITRADPNQPKSIHSFSLDDILPFRILALKHDYRAF
jgi:hypothetical protein